MENMVSSKLSREIARELAKFVPKENALKGYMRQVIEEQRKCKSFVEVIGLLGEAYVRLFLLQQERLPGGLLKVLKLPTTGVHGNYFYESDRGVIKVFHHRPTSRNGRGITVTDYDGLTQIGNEIYIWESKVFDINVSKGDLRRSLDIQRLNTIAEPVRQLYGLPVGHITAVPRGAQAMHRTPQRAYLRNNGYVTEYSLGIDGFREIALALAHQYDLHIDPKFRQRG